MPIDLKSNPTLEELAEALIAVFEGPMRLAAFRDTGGVWTIGRGHTGPDVTEGMVITFERGVELFAVDSKPLFELVRPLNIAPLAGAAYVSFGYNGGHGALHAVLTNADTIGNPKHTTDRHGIIQPGLVSRRRLEQLLIATCGQ